MQADDQATQEPLTGGNEVFDGSKKEAVPPESPPISQQTSPTYQTEVVPEAIAEEEVAPENLSPEEIEPQVAAPPPVFEEPPAGSNLTKYLILGFGIVFFVLIFIVVLKLLRGVGTSSSKKITLEYWGLWEDQSVMEPLIADYQRKNPNIKINYSKRDPTNYREKLLARAREGRGPDIFRYHNTWVPTIKEVVAPLPEKVMSNSEFEKTFYPVAQKDLKIDNFYYGLPLEIDGLVLVYNADLFKKAGIELTPKTWEDIVDYSTRLTVKDPTGQIITGGIALGTAENIEHFSDILGWMLLQNGADLKKLSATEAVETLSAYRKFAEVPDNRWDENMPNSIPAFVSEKVAMIIIPSWEILTIKAANPDLDFKVTVLPIVPGGETMSLANYWVEGVSKFSKNQVEAWKFLHFLTEKENMTKLYAQESKFRLFGEPYSRVDLQSTLLQNEYIGPVIEQAPKMKSLPLVTRTNDNGLNDEIVRYLKDAVNATTKGVSYQEAFDNAQKGVSQVMAKFGIN